MDGAEGAWAVVMPGDGFGFLFLVGTSLNPVVSTAVTAMAAQACFVAWAVVFWFEVCWVGGAVGFPTGAGLNFGARGVGFGLG